MKREKIEKVIKYSNEADEIIEKIKQYLNNIKKIYLILIINAYNVNSQNRIKLVLFSKDNKRCEIDYSCRMIKLSTEKNFEIIRYEKCLEYCFKELLKEILEIKCDKTILID